MQELRTRNIALILCILPILFGTAGLIIDYKGIFSSFTIFTPLPQHIFSHFLAIIFGLLFATFLLLEKKASTRRKFFAVVGLIIFIISLVFLIFSLGKNGEKINTLFLFLMPSLTLEKLTIIPVVWFCWATISLCTFLFFISKSTKILLCTEILFFIILLVALIGISTSTNKIYTVYSWMNYLSISTLSAASIASVAICALYIINHSALFQNLFSGSEEAKIIFSSSILLILTAINAAIAFFSVFAQQNEEFLATALNKSLDISTKYIADALSDEIEEIRSISHFSTLTRIIERKASSADIRSLKQTLKSQRFESYLVQTANGEVLLKNNPFSTSIMGYFDVGSDIPTTLFQDNDWYIHFDVPIYAESRLIGNLKLEHPIEALKTSLDPKNNFFESEERLLCEIKDQQIIKCFSSKNDKEQVVIHMNHYSHFNEILEKTPLSHNNMLVSIDQNNKSIIMGGAKIKGFNLAYIVKIDVDDIYNSLYGQLSVSFPILALFILFSIVLLTWQISPLVRKVIYSEKDALDTARLLIESEARLRAIVDNIGEAILVTDTNALLETLNIAAKKMFGYRNVEASNRHLGLLLHPPETSTHTSFIHDFINASDWVETTGIRKDGSFFLAQYHVSEIIVRQKKNYIIIIRDITEQRHNAEKIKESEYLFKSSFDFAPIGMVLISLNAHLLKVNQAFCNMLGLSEIELLNMELKYIISKDSWKNLRQQIELLIKEAVTTAEFNMELIGKNKSVVYTLASVSRIFDESGATLYYIAQVQDISSRKAVEEKLKSANIELQGRLKELNNHTMESNLLTEMSGLLQSCLTLDEAVIPISKYGLKLFPGTSGGLYLSRQNAHHFELVSQWGSLHEKNSVIYASDCWGLRRSQPYYVQEVSSEICCNHIHLIADEIKSYICIPLSAQGETFGLLYLEIHNKDTNKHKLMIKEFQRAAVAFADQITLALANIKLRESLHHQSMHDALTGLYNRRYMEEELNIEFMRALRKSEPLSLIMLDIDHFKQFNDVYGHEAGDLVLIEVSRIIKNHIRESDIPCRMGGEEFMMIIPDTTLELAKERAENICAAVSKATLMYKGVNLPGITISAGVATFPNHGTSKNEIVEAADKALYNAKKSGRNQVSTLPY